jgi:ArsR family transcriptional regulator
MERRKDTMRQVLQLQKADLVKQGRASSGRAMICPKTLFILNEEEASVTVRVLKVLADPTRLRILSLLNQHAGCISVKEIVQEIGFEQPTISYHLRILWSAGLIDFRKRGQWVYYFIKEGVVELIQKIFQKNALSYLSTSL